MEKSCNQCDTLFSPKLNVRGSEQIYCSPKCRNAAAQIRMISKIKENAIQETRQENIIASSSNNIRNDSNNLEQRTNYFSPDIIRLIESNFESRNKINELEIKNTYLEKEIQELRQQNINLELELDNIETPEDDNGMLGGIMQQFKTDPINTISFATEFISNLLKPKVNEPIKS